MSLTPVNDSEHAAPAQGPGPQSRPEQADELVRQAMLDAIDRVADVHGDRASRELAEAGHWPEALWQELLALGLTKAALAAEDGGADLMLSDLLPILGRLAYHALPVPIAETAIALTLARHSGFLPPSAWFDEALSFGLIDPQGRLSGLAFGQACRAVLVAKGQGDHASLAWIDIRSPSTARVAGRNLAGEACVDLQWPITALDGLHSQPLPHADRWLMQAGALLRSVQMSQAMSKALHLSLQFANERVQFGKPIGKFQAVQHMLAVMASEVAAASAIVQAATDAFARSSWPDAADADRCEWWVGAAKARCGEAASKVFEIAHQVHAAMGYTREHVLHFTTRRLLVWRDSFGAESYWQQLIGRQAMDLGPRKLWSKLVES